MEKERIFVLTALKNVDTFRYTKRNCHVFEIDRVAITVLVWFGQFCRDVIGRQNVKVVVAVIFDPSIVCLSVSFEVMYESFVRCR